MMGQYFLAVNTTKREYVDGFAIGGTAKLWEWCANREAGIFPYLLRRSSEGGGGDVLADDLAYAGRWAGDAVYLVGDYDDSGLYDRARATFADISAPLAREYNAFIELPTRQLDLAVQVI